MNRTQMYVIGAVVVLVILYLIY